MINSRFLVIGLTLAVAGLAGAAVATTQGKRAACVSTPVAGQPDVHIVTCKRRP